MNEWVCREQAALAARLEVLEAEAEIRRLISAHQWTSDAGSAGLAIPDWGHAPEAAASPGLLADDTSSAWSADGVWEGSGLSAMFADSTRHALGDPNDRFAADRPKWMPHMMHFLTNEQIEVTSPESAHGRWYSWEAATVVLDGEQTAIWIAGRYDVDLVREPVGWRILRMHFQEIFSTPFASRGWTHQPHVAYGPAEVTAWRSPPTEGCHDQPADRRGEPE